MATAGFGTRKWASDSPRWCEVCEEYGLHHTDRHFQDGVNLRRTASTGLLTVRCAKCGWSSREYRQGVLAERARGKHVCKR